MAAPTNPLSVDDNGGSLTVDGTVALDSATLTALESITVQNGSGASAVNIQDGGNTITVDGTVSVTEPVSIDDNGGSLTVDFAGGTLNNGAETSVTGTAGQVLASNANRKILIVQNVGNTTARIGVSGVTATTGIQLVAGGTLILDSPHCPTSAIFAIRESGANTTVFVTEVT
jgi:hypothetical protein